MSTAIASQLALISIAIGRLADPISFGSPSVTSEGVKITNAGERVVKLVLRTSRPSVVLGGIGMYDYV